MRTWPLLTVLLLSACGTVPGPRPIAVALPLVVLTPEATRPEAVEALDPQPAALQPHSAVAGPMVVGSRGEGLNLAMSIHRIFHAMGIRTEVRLAQEPTAGGEIQTRLTIRFPDALSEAERQDVARVLRLIRSR